MLATLKVCSNSSGFTDGMTRSGVGSRIELETEELNSASMKKSLESIGGGDLDSEWKSFGSNVWSIVWSRSSIPKSPE